MNPKGGGGPYWPYANMLGHPIAPFCAFRAVLLENVLNWNGLGMLGFMFWLLVFAGAPPALLNQ